MSGVYDNEWKNAFEGASIAPSEQLWEDIASNLDRGRGKRNWVTILLIAATVTVAFSFPLTVGNSSYEVNHQDFELAATDKNPESSSATLNEDTSNEIVAGHSSDQDYTYGSENKNTESIALVRNDDMISPAKNEESYITSASAQRLGIESMTSGDEPGLLHESYYILPLYGYDKKQSNRGLMALGNISSGNQSAGSGFGAMDMVFAASADSETSNLSNGYKNSITRSEEGGTSLYLGLGLELPIGRKFSFGTGLGYLNQKLDGTSNAVYNIEGEYHPLGAYDLILPGTVFLTENYNYTTDNRFISIPAYIKYPFIDRRIKFRGGLGLSTDFMVGHKINSDEYGDATYSPASTNYNTVILSGLLNLDVQVPITENYGLAVEAGVRRGFTSIVSEGDTFPTSFNLGVILFYKFSK